MQLLSYIDFGTETVTRGGKGFFFYWGLPLVLGFAVIIKRQVVLVFVSGSSSLASTGELFLMCSPLQHTILKCEAE